MAYHERMKERKGINENEEEIGLNFYFFYSFFSSNFYSSLIETCKYNLLIFFSLTFFFSKNTGFDKGNSYPKMLHFMLKIIFYDKF